MVIARFPWGRGVELSFRGGFTEGAAALILNSMGFAEATWIKSFLMAFISIVLVDSQGIAVARLVGL